MAGEPIQIFATNHGLVRGDRVTISGVQGKTRANGTFTVTGPVSNLFFTLAGTEGLDPRPYTGGGIVRGAGAFRRAATERSAEFSILGLLCSGPIQNIRRSFIEINDQPISNFPEAQVTTRLGATPQTAMPGFLDVRNSLTDGREVTGGGGIIYTTTVAVDEFVINLDWNNGLFHFDSRGQTSNWSDIRYRHRVSPSGAWSPFTEIRIEGNNTNQVRFSIDVRNISNAVRDINIEFVSAAFTDSARSAWQPFLTSVTEVQHTTTTFDSYALLGLRGVSSEDIQGPFPNVTVVVEGKLVRVGGFGVAPTFSDNPAWCTMDIMTDVITGMGVPDSEIDLARFIQWANRSSVDINGHPRNSFDYVLDTEKGYQRILAEVTESSHVEIINAEGVWSPRLIAESTPTFLLSQTSINNLVIDYFFNEQETNVVDVRFIDRFNKHRPTTLSWPDISNWPTDVRKQSIELQGVTFAEEVQRFAEVYLNEAFAIRRRISFNCSLEAFQLQKYDTFFFSHELPGWGTSGLILEGSTDTVLNLDTPVQIAAGTNYHIRVINSFTDAVELRQIAPVAPGTYTIVTLLTALTFTPESTNVRKSRFQFGEVSPDSSAVIYRVTSISLTDENFLEVQAVEHNDSIYTLPTAVPLPPISTLPNPNGIPPPIISLFVNETDRILPNGSSLTVVVLQWTVNPVEADQAVYGGAIIFRRTITANAEAGKFVLGSTALAEIRTESIDDGANYKRVGSVDGNVTEWTDITVVQGETYQYRVVPKSFRDVKNNIGFFEATIHVTGPTTPDFRPPAPPNLRLEGQAVGVTLFEDRDVVIEWDEIVIEEIFRNTLFIKDYIIEVWGCEPTSDQAFRLHPRRNQPQALVTETRFRYPLTLNAEDSLAAGAGGPQRNLTFKVWARTGANIISNNSADLTVSNPPPDFSGSTPRGATGLVNAGAIDFSNFVIPRDIAGFRILLDQVSPPTTINQELGPGSTRVIIDDLANEEQYFVSVLPLDRFGPGIASQPALFTTISLDGTHIEDGTVTASQLITGEVVIAETAQLGNLIVDTIKIRDNAVTSTVQTVNLGNFVINTLNQRTELVRVTFSTILPGDTVIIHGVSTSILASSQSNPGRVELFIQEDDINGPTVGVPTASAISIGISGGINITLSYLDNMKTQGTFPNLSTSPLTNKSFIISAEVISFGSAQSDMIMSNTSIIALKRSK